MIRSTNLINQDRVFSIACLLCAIPVVVSHYPPMVDLPQHAAQISAVRGILGETWGFADLFELNWFTPYWLGYGLVLALSELVGIVWAFKLVLAAAVCAFPWAAGRFCTRMGCPPAWNWMLIPLPFGFAYQWGFFNFIVAAPFGFLFLCALLEVRDRSGWLPYVKIGLWLHFLFFAHVLTAAFFCIVAALLLASPWNGLREWSRRCLPILTILPVAGLWLFTSLRDSPTASAPVVWSLGPHRLTGFLPSFVSSPTAAAGQVLGLLVLALPLLSGARIRRNVAAWAPFVAYVSWLLLFPHLVGGTSFTYERFSIFGVPLYFICFEAAKTGGMQNRDRVIGAGLALVSVFILGWHGIRASTFNQETARYQSVMQQAEPGKRVLMMTFDPRSHASASPLMLHLGCWYQAEHGGLCEFNFASNWVTPARFREGTTGIQQSFEWAPQSFDWTRHRGDVYDYFLVRHPASAESWLREKSHGAVGLLASDGEWQLYAKTGHRSGQETPQ